MSVDSTDWSHQPSMTIKKHEKTSLYLEVNNVLAPGTYRVIDGRLFRIEPDQCQKFFFQETCGGFK